MDLVEEPHKGIIAILDEACLTVGKVTDALFLESMNCRLGRHPHFASRKVRSRQQPMFISSAPGKGKTFPALPIPAWLRSSAGEGSRQTNPLVLMNNC